MKAIQQEHLLEAIKVIDKQGIRPNRKSSTYDVAYNGKLYPPKLIVSIANRFATGTELDHKNFSGGIGTQAFKLLENNGFKIIKKEMNPIVDLIQRYKKHIKNTELKDEVYKWELLKTYKGRPDPNAQDFKEEIGDIKFQNLLYQMSTAVINHIAKEYPVELSEKFEFLFNENELLLIRLNTFKAETLKLYRKLEDKLGTHQDERSMATYLTLHNPEKYTFYKSSFYKKYCKVIGVKPAKAGQKYIHYLELINDLVDNYVKKDTELIDLVNAYIPQQYNSDNHLLLAQDILYQMLDKVIDTPNYWIFQGNPKIYDIKTALADNAIDTWAVKAHKDKIIEGDKVILWVTGKDSGCYALADVISDVYEGTDEENQLKYYADKNENVSASRVKIKVTLDCSRTPITKEEINKIPKLKSLKVGSQGTNFSATQTEYNAIVQLMNSKSAMNKKDIKINKPLNQILYGPPGTGKTFALKKEYFSKYTSKETSISKAKHFENVVKECSWWQVIAIALLDLGKSKVSDIFKHTWVQQKALLSDSKTVRPTLWGQLQTHTVESCEFVGVKNRRAPFIFNKTENSDWEILEDEVKEQVPELYELMDRVNNFVPNPDKEIKRYKFTTFHQSFSYEDFIEGIKPIIPENGEESDDLGYKVEDGLFKQMCKDAENDPDNKYAIFIDEINRGNVSAIFGELITLIEPDKRKGAKNEISVVLPYSKKPFAVPQNLDIIGTMNTADRSVEALDTALRRRFSFVEMMPKPELLKDSIINGIDLNSLLKTINERIEVLIDRDHTIGHAYFINVTTEQELKETFKNNIVPLLQEYFFGDYGKIGLVLGEGFVKAIQPKTNVFANLKNYDGALDYNQTAFELITINDDFNITEAIAQLLPNSEEQA